MELKADEATLSSVMKERLKSDQDGIESPLLPIAPEGMRVLKSDQDGIESNTALYANGDICQKLKSDQDGIERSLVIANSLCKRVVKIRPRWD